MHCLILLGINYQCKNNLHDKRGVGFVCVLKIIKVLLKVIKPLSVWSTSTKQGRKGDRAPPLEPIAGTRLHGKIKSHPQVWPRKFKAHKGNPQLGREERWGLFVCLPFEWVALLGLQNEKRVWENGGQCNEMLVGWSTGDKTLGSSHEIVMPTSLSLSWVLLFWFSTLEHKGKGERAERGMDMLEFYTKCMHRSLWTKRKMPKEATRGKQPLPFSFSLSSCYTPILPSMGFSLGAS